MNEAGYLLMTRRRRSTLGSRVSWLTPIKIEHTCTATITPSLGPTPSGYDVTFPLPPHATVASTVLSRDESMMLPSCNYFLGRVRDSGDGKSAYHAFSSDVELLPLAR